MNSLVILVTKISSINMFNHEYKRVNAHNFKKTVQTERLLFKD
jgi:hypothetical protein